MQPANIPAMFSLELPSSGNTKDLEYIWEFEKAENTDDDDGYSESCTCVPVTRLQENCQQIAEYNRSKIITPTFEFHLEDIRMEDGIVYIMPQCFEF